MASPTGQAPGNLFANIFQRFAGEVLSYQHSNLPALVPSLALSMCTVLVTAEKILIHALFSTEMHAQLLLLGVKAAKWYGGRHRFGCLALFCMRIDCTAVSCIEPVPPASS